VLAQSELIQIPGQMRPISQPVNLPFQQYPPSYPQASFMPINSLQASNQLQRQQQYQNHTAYVIPHQQNQFIPNWINQSQTPQAREQDHRSNTQVISGRPQLQSQGTQSQKSIGQKQTEIRKPLIDRGNNQHSASQSPAKIVFNYNLNSSRPAIVIKPAPVPQQVVHPHQILGPQKPQPSQQTYFVNQ
jgi:hypothetical protein